MKFRFKVFKSLKLRLYIVIIIFGMLPVSAYAVISARLYLSSAISQRISELQSHANIISNLVVNSNFFASDDVTELNTELSQVADVYKGRILVIEQGLRIARDTYGLEDGKTIISKEIIETFAGENSKYINTDDAYVEITVPIRNNETQEIIGAIFMSFSIENIMNLYSSRLKEIITFVIIFGVLIIVASIFVVNKLVAPVKALSGRIKEAAENGETDMLMDFKGYSELEDVAIAYNNMVDTFRDVEASRMEFVSNVSHELRTPITSMKVLAESLISQEEVPVELYKEFMEDINSELERINNIINDLLTLVKTDRSVSTSIITTVNINELIEGLLKTLRPIAAQRNIELVFESFRQVNAEVDATKLGMAFNNLIENAIKYNYDDGWVRVSLNADHRYFYLKVSDSGVGIPEEVQGRIYERFYRVDQARSRDAGGTGLGLAITRNIILLHRGAIKVYSKEGQGTVFTVRIPLNFQA